MQPAKIAVFYHCLFADQKGETMPAAVQIVGEQTGWLSHGGLYDSAQEIHCGINGGLESEAFAALLLPQKSSRSFHGLQCRNELRTILLMEQWVKSHPGWNVFYFHSKGATHPFGDERSWKWRYCMMNNLVSEWGKCVRLLDSGYDSVGCHWMEPPATPIGQRIWAGNFFWAKSDFLATLPSVTERARVQMSGLDALESRFEAEVWIGNGPTPPKVFDLHPNGRGICY